MTSDSSSGPTIFPSQPPCSVPQHQCTPPGMIPIDKSLHRETSEPLRLKHPKKRRALLLSRAFDQYLDALATLDICKRLLRLIELDLTGDEFLD